MCAFKKIFVLLLLNMLSMVVLVAPVAAATVLANDQSPLGVNISPISYWSTELPLVDFFKRSSLTGDLLWGTQCDTCSGDTGEQSALDLDTQGWPRSLPATGANILYRYVTTYPVMSTNRYPAGRYTVFYDGEGTLDYGMDAVRNAALSQAGADIIDVAPNQGFSVSIRSTDPNHTGNYLRNIRIIPPGGTCNNDPTSYAADSSVCPSTYQPFTSTYQKWPFHPMFLNDLKYFSAIRYMNFAGIVTTQVKEWKDRPQLTYASYGASFSHNGSPIELAIDLANTLNASPWLIIPAKASDDYITQFARLVKSRLTTTRPIYLEYHNEVWNLANPYNIIGTWVEQQGQARWPASGESALNKRLNWYAMRMSDACRIWKQEFGSRSSQVKCVMGSWLDYPLISTTVLSCPLYAQEAGHNCAVQMDALAVAPYFGVYFTEQPYQGVMTGWTTLADGGLGSLFTEINTGLIPRQGTNQPLSALGETLASVNAQEAIAQQYGLQLVAYEGGQHLGAPMGGTNPDYTPTLQALFEKANRDARMGTVYQSMLNGWKQAGGNLFMLFQSTEAYGGDGQFGLLEYEGETRSQAPKYDAALNFIGTNNCWWPGCTGDNNCAASVSSSLVVHIPVVTYGGANYWADLQYNSADSTLSVTNAGTVNDVSSYSSCMASASTLSSDYKLHIPVVILNGLSYWVNLQYGNAVFAITGGGQN